MKSQGSKHRHCMTYPDMEECGRPTSLAKNRQENNSSANQKGRRWWQYVNVSPILDGVQKLYP